MSFSPLTPSTDFALDVYLLDAQARALSPRTVHFYRQQIGWFNAYLALQNCRELQQVTPHHIRAYLLHLQEGKRLKSASVHAAARAIRAFMNFCVVEELITTSPMQRVKMPKLTEELLPAYSDQEVRALLRAATHQRDRAMLLCLLDTGCRANEFLAWNVEDVNLVTGTVRVRYTKNRRERTVYLGLKARRELAKLIGMERPAPDDPVWRTLDNRHTRLHYHGLKSLLHTLGKVADVHPCGPHRFRRTFALMALRNGMNVYALQRIMGHSDLTVLRRYLALMDDDLREAHKQFGAVDRMFK